MRSIAHAGEYLSAVEEAYERAASSAGREHARTIAIAGHGARLRFAGEALIPRVMPALAHLETDSTQPALEIQLFDSTTTGVPLPTLPRQDLVEAGEGWVYDDHASHIMWNPHLGTLMMLDAPRGVGYFWTKDASEFSYHDMSFPLRHIWQWWLRPYGLVLAHAAAVADERGAIVIVGASGAGKSSTALACLISDLGYLGDDFTLLRAEPTPHVYSLYCSAKLHADHWKRFPHLQNAVTNADRLDREKALMFVNIEFASQMQREAPAHAMVLPRVVGSGETRAVPVTAARVLRELAVSTIFLLRGAGKAEFEALASFARQLPCYELQLGADLRQIPNVLQHLPESA